MGADTFIEMLLFSAGAMSCLLALLLIRRGGLAHAPYLLILLGESGAAFALFFLHSRDPVSIGAVLSAFVLFLILPMTLSGFARRLARTDRFAAASGLLLLRFPLVLSPYSWAELRITQAFECVHRGRFGEAIAILDGLRASPLFGSLEPMLLEAILDLHLKAFRWSDAAAFLDREGRGLEIAAARLPRLAAYALRVRCETGRLDLAAGILRTMVEGAPDPFSWGDVASAAMIFLGCAGDETRLAELFERHGRFLAGLPPSVRDLWLGRARAVRGDAEGAGILFDRAREQALEGAPHILGRIRHHAESGFLAPAPQGPFEIPWPLPFPDEAAYVSAQEFASPRARALPVTTGFLALLLLAAVVSWAAGATDIPMFVALGANVRFLVESGQIWRLGSSTLLHVGMLHLVLNAMGLLFLGRLMENLYGPARFLTLYVLSGFGGSLCSHLLSEAQISVGASGAVFGLVGAGIAFLVFHGNRLPARTRGIYLFVFLFVAGADFLFGIHERIIDSHAHLGGLAAGFAVGAILRPVLGAGRAPAPWRRAAAGILAVASALSLGLCVLAAAVDFASGSKIPVSIPMRVVEDPGGVWRARIPAHWLSEPHGGGARFMGMLVDCQVDLLERRWDLSVEEQARRLLEERMREAGRIRPLFEPGSPPGGGHRAVVFDVFPEPDRARRTYFIPGRGILAVLSVEGSARSVESFGGVAAAMAAEFRFLGEDAHD